MAGLFLLDIVPLRRTLVLTVPRGAAVSVGGAPSTASPVYVPVHRGGTRVSVSHPGFTTVDSTLFPGSGPVVVYLERTTGLVVTTVPPGLPVETEGFYALSPCTVYLSGPGSSQVTVRGSHGIHRVITHGTLVPGLQTVTVEMPVFLSGDPDMVWIPGSLLAPGLWAGRTEVTVEQFSRFMNSVDPELRRSGFQLPGRTVLSDSLLRCNWPLPVEISPDTTRYRPLPGMENHPMYGMTQEAAEWYCRWLTETDGRGFSYRLPEPGEWRVLAGAGMDWRPLPGNFNCSDINETILGRHPEIDDGYPATAPVGSYPPNPWGLYDTAGNLWEWTARPGKAAGGSWLSSVEDCFPDALADFSPEIGYPFVGFRVVADPPAPPDPFR